MVITSRQMIDGASVLRFDTAPGVIWAAVRADGSEASLEVYEQAAALASRGKADDEANRTPEAVFARNRFGTGLMLRVCRAIRAEFPSVLRWRFKRVSGAHPGRERVRA